jgi:Dehydrogenases with different specificities (related to short-chain alcohol dehydrogenases)
MKLQDRVAVITGAGSGIGRAMALLFSREGAKIVAADVNAAAAAETAELVRAQGGQAASTAVDVTNPEQVQAMLKVALDQFGKLDILCNNAGIGSTTTVVDCEPDEWDRVMTVNAKGVFLGCKYAVPIMIEQGGGCIINTASVAGMIGIPERAVYCASKGAVIALTKQVAVEYVEKGIRCNCVCPGTVDSPWVGRLLQGTADPEKARSALEARQPMGRLGKPEEVAAAALYLASDDAAFVTGSALVLDGGWTAR